VESTEVSKEGGEIQVEKYGKEYGFLCKIYLEVLRKNVREVKTHMKHTRNTHMNGMSQLLSQKVYFLQRHCTDSTNDRSSPTYLYFYVILVREGAVVSSNNKYGSDYRGSGKNYLRQRLEPCD
jgi:hypothetical protein